MSKEYSLIKAEWKIEEGQTVLYLIARDNVDKKIYLPIYNYFPYFFIEKKAQSFPRLLPYVNVEKSDFKCLNNNQPVLKIMYSNPIDTIHVKRHIEHQHFRTYEADMVSSKKFPLKFLIDYDIKSGFKQENDSIVPIERNANYRIFYIDVEASSPRTYSVDPAGPEPLIIIGVYDNYTQKYTIFYVETGHVNSIDVDANLVVCKDEKELLIKFIEFIEEHDPDILTAFNLERYDLAKIIYRIRSFKINSNLLSPAKFRRVYKKGREWIVKGRIIFDLLIAYRELTSKEYPHYNLEYICNEIEKFNIPFIEIENSYKEDWEKDPSKIITLNYYHLVAIKRLNEEAHVIEFYEELRKLAGCPLKSALSRKKIIDAALLRLSKKRLIVLPSEKRFERGKFPGAIVVDPIPGLHENVIHMDLKGAYPNIIMAYNISPETTSDVGGIEISDKYKFLSQNKGLIPELIETWVKKREEKKQLQLNSTDPNEERRYKIQANSLKFTANACYGVMSYPSFRAYQQLAAEAVAYLCRKAIEFGIAKLQEFGCTILYGDTDGIFLTIKSNNILKTAKEIEKKINESLVELKNQFKITDEDYHIKDNPFSLNLKKIYSKFWLIEAKKKYAGLRSWSLSKGIEPDVLEIIGWEVIRSDASYLERAVLKQLISMKLRKDPLNDQLKYWNNIKDKFLKKLYPPNQLGYPARIKTKIDNYGKVSDKTGKLVSVPAHVKGVLYSNKYLNTRFKEGSKPIRIPINSKRLVVSPIYYQDHISKKVYDSLNKNNRYVKVSREFIMKDIAIDYYTKLSTEFLGAIDYDRILERLEGKIYKVIPNPNKDNKKKKKRSTKTVKKVKTDKDSLLEGYF